MDRVYAFEYFKLLKRFKMSLNKPHIFVLDLLSRKQAWNIAVSGVLAINQGEMREKKEFCCKYNI